MTLNTRGRFTSNGPLLADSGTLMRDNQLIAPSRGAVRQNQIGFWEEAIVAPSVNGARNNPITVCQIILAVVPRRPFGLFGFAHLCFHCPDSVLDGRSL